MPPAEKLARPASVRTDSGDAIGQAAKASILIVDDKAENLLALAEMLQGPAEEVVQARSGREALRCLLRQDFALVLLDIQMPDMDGYELAELIRQRHRSRGVPIIFITAFNRDDQDVSRGYALGAVDYVFKPIDPVILRAKVSVFVDLFNKTEAVRRQAELERHLQLENLRVRTAKIEAERALRQIEERQSLIIKSQSIALYTADLNGRFAGPRFLSDSIAETVGLKAAAFVEDGDLWPARIHPDDLSRVLEQVASIVDSGSMSIEYRLRCADGQERMILDQGVLVRDENGAPKEIFGTCLDISYRRKLEQQLQQSQKMEAIGQLTGGIAHDFNNMLSVIIWNLDVLMRGLDASSKPRNHAQMALGGALSCAELIRQLLTFARHQPQQTQLVDLLELVPRMARLLTPVIGEQIEVNLKLADGLWPILADPAQVESALLNLSINARDAMPNGGSLSIEATNVDHDGELGPGPGEYVVLSVADSGVGMAPEVMERAFEPFFTTKSAGQGNGLGLSMVYGFAKQSGGFVRIESATGMGTTVRLYLPRALASENLMEQQASDLEVEEGQTDRTILAVEDNEEVRRVTVARLVDLGYRVLEANGAAAALEIIGSDATIDLMFTDVVMPGGMDGIDLARHALKIRPDLKVLFASGYASTFRTTGGVHGELLPKPYRDDDLIRALARAFRGTAPAAAPTGSMIEARPRTGMPLELVLGEKASRKTG